ncbi:PREDICTED: coiled-coil domain-containing protein 146-like [Amphimedon queenslandica]|uniref:Cilia- and flagella-associated protein 58 central coiled coil domain-containing protein n=1 Tax=Amphimedon queenslandica TaxID=400682 RepID=A0AAN0JI71_AMPQE|nr:PREDICTED: coiled-coil domain-containing protein 146-like [Amphimedon queenslandica]|eukprot:XP_019856501.1 PREDICTED: coiled-coil domain-containing protein 146-like [Amphimedon queenslandica]
MLCQYYEQVVQSRNDTGLQLIERNEEVCVFHEKINVQATITQQGIAKLAEKEEEVQFLKMELARLQREIKINRDQLPEKEELERELTLHQNMLLSTKESLKCLEEEMCDARNPERVRLLAGKDPSCKELRERVQKLQDQLSEREHQLLEKELLMEQIQRLLGRTQKKVEARKETTFQVGTKGNHYQSKLRELTKKIRSNISELSVQQVRREKEKGERKTYSKL